MTKPLKHLCGQCSKSFKSQAAYLSHRCAATGYSPKEPQHFEAQTHSAPQVVLVKKKISKISESNILAAVTAARKAKQRHA